MPTLESDKVVVGFELDLEAAKAELAAFVKKAKEAGETLKDSLSGDAPGDKTKKKPTAGLGPEAAWWKAMTAKQREEMRNRVANHLWAVKRMTEGEKSAVEHAKKSAADRIKAAEAIAAASSTAASADFLEAFAASSSASANFFFASYSFAAAL